MLTLGLLNDLRRLLLGCIDEFIAFFDQFDSDFDFPRQGIADRIQQFNRIVFVDQTTAAERDPTALEKNILELIQMIEDNQASVAHVNGAGKPN